jgi:hypothetical protein
MSASETASAEERGARTADEAEAQQNRGLGLLLALLLLWTLWRLLSWG